MSDSRGALHHPFRSDVWILSQTVVCFSLWFDRFCASVPAASGRECRSKSGHACQNAFCVGSDGVWHGIAFACALTAKDRDLHSVQRLPLTFELASLATTLGVRHGLVILDAQQYHSGGCLVGGTSVKGGIVFERVLICYGPVGNISASSGLFILLDMAR